MCASLACVQMYAHVHKLHCTIVCAPSASSASIFANVLMQSREEEGKGKTKGKKSIAAMSKKKATFVYQFLMADSLL